jgi:hypothetical protein
LGLLLFDLHFFTTCSGPPEAEITRNPSGSILGLEFVHQWC